MGGLPLDFTEQELIGNLGVAGEVTEVRLPKDAAGQCLGCAYVTFADDSAAHRACEVKQVGCRCGLGQFGLRLIMFVGLGG